MYQQKADFFDGQVNAPWAADPYNPAEMAKLDGLFARLGSLKGMTILEPGCGTGRLTKILAEQAGPDGCVLALDISQHMISVAQQRIKNHPNVEVQNIAVEDADLPTAHFDLVLCHQVFPHFSDQRRALAQLALALKPSGTLILYHFIDLNEINDVHRKAGTVVENDMMPDQQTMERLFAEAGLRITDMRENGTDYFLSAKK